MSKNKLRAIFEAGFEAVYSLVKKQSEEISALKKRIKALEDRLGKNSTNSSKPPSSDWPKKRKNLRKRSDKAPGGQKGHKGHNLKMVENPDYTEIHQLDTCNSCGCSLKATAPTGYKRRQVFELPPIEVEVTEHRAEEKTCPHCGANNQASFPDGITQPAQYGPRIKAILTYLNQYQLIPYQRLSELFYDLFGHSLSQGTLVNTNRTCFEALKISEEAIKDKIISSPVVHFDETGLYTEGKICWLHVASTEDLTYYAPHPKRGKKATDDIGILPNFYGIAVHDFWATYFKYDCGHALCNAHHLRELKGIEDFYDQKWATDMALLLVKIKKAVDKSSEVLGKLDKKRLDSFKGSYDKIISQGLAQNPPVREGPKKRGRVKKSKAANLLYRLKDYWEETLSFMYNFEIPFDNNLAERDVRMTKVQQKISGTFRSSDGAKTFCRIRGYISTARKNSLSVIDAIQAAFEGNPFMVSVES